MSCIIPKLDNFLYCFSLRKVRVETQGKVGGIILFVVMLQGILLSVILNSLICTLLLLLYIPYSLNWSPVREQIEAQKNGRFGLRIRNILVLNCWHFFR